MKKMFKKSIACLIAVLMVFATMPFTALADSYSDFNAMKSNLTSFTAYSPSAIGSFNGDNDLYNYTDHYKGLVYSQAVNTYAATGSKQLGSDWTGSNTCYANLYFPQAVALYTGSNEITVPVMISASVSRGGTWNCKFRPQAGIISGTGMSLAMNKWGGKDEVEGGSNNCYANGNQTSNIPRLNFMWTVAQTNYVMSTDKTVGTNKDIDPGYGKKAQIFANKVKITPSFNATATTVTTASYNPTITLYVSSSGKGFEDKSIELASTNAVTVVNYKVYLDKLAQAKSDVAALAATDYTEASVSAYVTACNNLMAINPTSYDYASNTASAVSSLVTAMNNAISGYDTAKAGLKLLHVHTMSNWAVETAGTCNTAAVEERHCTADDCDDVNKAKETRTGSTNDANHESLDATWTAVVGGSNHYKHCSACNDYVYENCDKNDVVTGTSATCNDPGTTDEIKCSVCGRVWEASVPTTANGHDYGDWSYAGNKQHTRTCETDPSHTETDDCTIVKGACTECGEVFVDFSVYLAAIDDSEALDLTGFTAASKAAYLAEVEDAKVADDASQEEVNAATTRILVAKALLKVEAIHVDLYKVVDGVESLIEDYDVDYATPLTFTVDASIAKWIVTTDEGQTTTKVASNVDTIDMIATKSAKVYAFVAETPAVEKNIKVTYLGKGGKVVDVAYITAGEEIDTTVVAPTLAFYNFTGWELAYKSNENIYVIATYEAIQAEEDLCQVYYNDEKVGDYAYDSYVYLPGIGNKTLVITDGNGNVLTYSSTCDFYVPKTDVIKVYDADPADAQASVAITGSYKTANDFDATTPGKAAVFNCKFFLPADCEVVEWGAVVYGGANSKVVKAEKASERNEYSIRFTIPATSSLNKLSAKAFVKYYDADDNLQIIYSSEVAQAL